VALVNLGDYRVQGKANLEGDTTVDALLTYRPVTFTDGLHVQGLTKLEGVEVGELYADRDVISSGHFIYTSIRTPVIKQSTSLQYTVEMVHGSTDVAGRIMMHGDGDHAIISDGDTVAMDFVEPFSKAPVVFVCLGRGNRWGGNRWSVSTVSSSGVTFVANGDSDDFSEYNLELNYMCIGQASAGVVTEIPY
jgi:hypothetical protein